MGYKLWELLGDHAQLFKWNEALSKLNEPLVNNDEASAQFQEHIDSCGNILRSIIRHTIRTIPESEGFKSLEKELLNLKCPPEYLIHYWVIDFKKVMELVKDILLQWGTDSNVIMTLENALTKDELYNQLGELGLKPELDPIEIHAENYKLFFHNFEVIQKAALVWYSREKIDEGLWGEDKETFEIKFSEDFEKSAYVDVWNDELC